MSYPKWSFRVATAPVPDNRAGSSPGRPWWRTVWPGFGSPYSDFTEIDLGGFIPQIVEHDDRVEARPIFSGGSALVRVDRERIGLDLQADALTGEDWAAVERIAKAGRPVMFCPDYDATTLFSSNFGAREFGGGVALVGPNGSPYSMMVGGSTSRVVADEHSGRALLRDLGSDDDGVEVGLTRGLIGRAARFNRQSDNLLTSIRWSPGATSTTRIATLSNVSNTGTTAWIGPGGKINAVGPPSGLGDALSFTLSLDLRIESATGHNLKLVIARGDGAEIEQAITPAGDGSWQRVEQSLTNYGAGTWTISLFNDALGGGVIVHTGAMMLESGEHGSEYIPTAAGAVTDSDSLFVDQALEPGAGLSFLFWLKLNGRHDSDTQRYLASWQDGGSDRYIRIVSGGFSFNLVGVTHHTGDLGQGAWNPDGWNQVGIVFQAHPNGTTQTVCYLNGVQAYSVSDSPVTLPEAAAGFWLFCAKGLGSTPFQYGVDADVDMVRVDARAWSADDIAGDWELKTDPGLAGLLAQTQGRLYRFVFPGRFRAPLTSQVVGAIRLDPAGYIEAALA